ncbi:HAD family hydrolase [Sharpea azabuensis]|uniref:HAD family hydrolase n=1 Tax=Sharpea azabuensis TaxID=322505 RepID=UPI00051CA4C1|nr:HAD family phosphatase [Sharpea azabuensis]
MKEIIFDIGGVLLNWNPDVFLKKYFAGNEERLKKIVFLSDEWKMLDLGNANVNEVRALILKHHPNDIKAINFIFDHFEEEMLQPIDDTVKAIKALKKAGYKFYILSNIHQDLFHKRTHDYHEIFSLFSGAVLSGEEHCLKPDPAIYHILFKRYNLTPSNCLFIDDSPANIETARKLGMEGIVRKEQQNLIAVLKTMGIFL